MKEIKTLALLSELKKKPVRVDPGDLAQDGNILAILGKFRRAARRQRPRWTQKETHLFIDYLLEHSYQEILEILMEYIVFEEKDDA